MDDLMGTPLGDDDLGLDDPGFGGPGLDDPGLGGPGIGGPGFDDPGLDGPDLDKELELAEDRLARASAALDAATAKEGEEVPKALIAEVEEAKKNERAAKQKAREAASITYSPETKIINDFKVAAKIKKRRIKTIKKRPADDDGAVAPLLKEGHGGTKRQRTRDPTIVDDCGVVNDRTPPRSTIDEVIDGIRTTTIPGIEASIARLERLLGITPGDNPSGSETVDSFYTIDGKSPVDIIAGWRENLIELNNIIAGLEDRKREIETIESEERELRRRYEELCRRGEEA